MSGFDSCVNGGPGWVGPGLRDVGFSAVSVPGLGVRRSEPCRPGSTATALPALGQRRRGPHRGKAPPGPERTSRGTRFAEFSTLRCCSPRVLKHIVWFGVACANTFRKGCASLALAVRAGPGCALSAHPGRSGPGCPDESWIQAGFRVFLPQLESPISIRSILVRLLTKSRLCVRQSQGDCLGAGLRHASAPVRASFLRHANFETGAKPGFSTDFPNCTRFYKETSGFRRSGPGGTLPVSTSTNVALAFDLFIVAK